MIQLIRRKTERDIKWRRGPDDSDVACWLKDLVPFCWYYLAEKKNTASEDLETQFVFAVKGMKSYDTINTEKARSLFAERLAEFVVDPDYRMATLAPTAILVPGITSKTQDGEDPESRLRIVNITQRAVNLANMCGNMWCRVSGMDFPGVVTFANLLDRKYDEKPLHEYARGDPNRPKRDKTCLTALQKSLYIRDRKRFGEIVEWQIVHWDQSVTLYLVDDVLTTGFHIRAQAEFLRQEFEKKGVRARICALVAAVHPARKKD